MATGKVSVVQVNNNQGNFNEEERIFLFIGKAETNDKAIHAISSDSDLDNLFGSADSDLKTQLIAAIANAKSDNFACYAIGADPSTDDWKTLLDSALEAPNDLRIEGVALCLDFVTDKAEVEGVQTELDLALSKYAKYLSGFVAVPGIDVDTQTIADYKTAIKALNTDVLASRVSLVPQLHGTNLGMLIGRLCNPATSLADSPMRVATGGLTAIGDSAPVDSAGTTLTMADLKELSEARFSVPQWYNGYNGLFFADAMMLDNEGGDFQVFENLRIMDYLARRVRILAIARIADRRLNSTRKSIEQNKTYFLRPLRESSQEITIGNQTHPGMIEAPTDDAIQIVWNSQTEVSVAITAKPYNNPKSIKVYLGLDLAGV